MTTREDVIDAISRIEKAGRGGEVTRTAQLELLLLPAQNYDRMMKRLQAAFPQLFAAADPAATNPPPVAAPDQQGVAAQAMRQAEAALAHQQSVIAEFDRQVIKAVLNAHKTTTEGRRLLAGLEDQIDCAARAWDLSTSAGARHFQRFLISKLDQVVRVVEEANDDDKSRQALAAAWAALYAAQVDSGETVAIRQGDPPKMSDGPPLDASDVAGIPYPTGLPVDELESTGVSGVPRRTVPEIPMVPAIPGFGGAAPSGGGLPTGGIPAGLAPASLPRVPSPVRFDDRPLGSDDDRPAAADAPADEPRQEDGDAAGGLPSTDLTTVRLPDGETVTAATPRLAAVMQAAVDGTPVAEAFRQQGITIPPVGSAVAVPIDQSRVTPGDIGMFTDRHALALGSSKALLDGQIQQIGNIGGPSFLGWQHPPTVGEVVTPTPAPTRLSATLRA